MSTYKAPNVKAPRFRANRKEIVTKEFFEKFKSAHPEHNVTFKKVRDVIDSHSKMMWNTIIENRDGVELPSGGVVFIATYKPAHPTKLFNQIASIKAGRKILHRNHKTDGYVAKIFYCYSMSKTGSRRKSLWRFKGGRTFTRTVAKTFPDRWKQYIYWPDIRKISERVMKHAHKTKMLKRTERALETYNEFDFN